MNLFHAISTYQLLSIILYKQKCKDDNKSILMITNTLVNKFPNYQELEKYFNQIVVYDISMHISSSDNCKIQITNHFNKILNDNKLNINYFDNIFLAGAHHYFGIFLAINNIKFTFFEDASGLLSKPYILENIERDVYKLRYSLNKEYGLYDGSCSSITNIVCNINAQREDAKQINNIIHFDVIKELETLQYDIRYEIMRFFNDIEYFEVESDSTVFLTQHFAGLNILNFEDHVLIYQLVIDYFFDNKNLIFKVHPDDVMYYSILFPKAKIIRHKFPSEFLPFIFSQKPSEIATITSTAINNLYPYFDKLFKLDSNFEIYFKSIHKYYIAIKFLERTGYKNVNYIGSNDNLMKNLIGHTDINLKNISVNKIEKIDFDNDNNGVYIIDDIEYSNSINEKDIINLLDNISPNSIMIFINSNKEYCFYDYEYKHIWQNIIPICINKKIIKSNEIYVNDNEEIIYLYSKNKEIASMAKQLVYNKKLESTGIEISIANLSEEQRKIKVLEGLLEATEKRLLHYIKLIEENEKVESVICE